MVWDVAHTFVKGELPNCRDKPDVPKDGQTLGLDREKLMDVRGTGYIMRDKKI